MDFLRRIMTKKPPTPDKMVFISYRREVGGFIAHTIFTYLRANGYDAFMDVESLDSGAFDNMLLNQIATRNHFIVILAPGTVERCANEDDWVRREIEYAMQTGRNIIPVMVNNFSFEQVDVYLTGKLADLRRYNGVTLHLDYLDAGLERIRNRFLKGEPVPLQPVTINTAEMKVVEAKIEAIATEEAPSKEELKAEYFFGIGYGLQETGDLAGAIAQYTEAIRVNPNYRRAYYNRALAYQKQGDNDQAEADYRQVIRIDPTYPKGYNNLGVLLMDAGRDDEALEILNRGIDIAPKNTLLYQNRGNLRQKMGDETGAKEDLGVLVFIQKKPLIPSTPPSFLGTSYGATPAIHLPQPETYPATGRLEPLPPTYGATRPLPDAPFPVLYRQNLPSDIGIVTDAGVVKSINQDACSAFMGMRYAIDDKRRFGCFIVAGGLGDNEKASQLAIQIIEKHIISQLYFASVDESAGFIFPDEAIKNAYDKANTAITESVPEGGTTVTVVVIIGDIMTVGHVGNCRAYSVSTSSIEQLTRDHTLVQRLVELEQLAPEDVKNHPQRDIIYRTLGQNEPIDVDIITRQLTTTEKIVLCTDGLTNLVSEVEIMNMVISYPPSEAAQKLVLLALERGGADNITVIVV